MNQMRPLNAEYTLCLIGTLYGSRRLLDKTAPFDLLPRQWLANSNLHDGDSIITRSMLPARVNFTH